MKRAIRVTTPDGKVKKGEVEIPNKLHLEIQQRNRASVFRNRKAYTRKIKHPNLDD